MSNSINNNPFILFDKSPWLNVAKPLTQDNLKGQVVLLDFWTYCCINCIHVLDDLKQLEGAFQNQSFMVIGVHSAKFANERNQENIISAIARYGISHPVIIDNNHEIWDSFGIRAWPSFILIDSVGQVRGRASGEKIFQTMHRSILRLLAEGRKNNTLQTPLKLTPTIKSTENTLSFPGKIAKDTVNNRLFISDSNHNRILVTEINQENLKIIDTIGSKQAGNEIGSYSQAKFRQPQGLTYAENTLYVCDTGNHLIKTVDLVKKQVKTIAGTEVQSDWKTQSGSALTTDLNSPWDCVCVDNWLYIAMAGSHQIWRLDLKSNILEKFAGSGWENLLDGKRESAQFAQPSGITINDQYIFIADSETSSIRTIDLRTNIVKTLIGSGLFEFGEQNGELGKASLQHPIGIDYLDNQLLIADTYNHALRLIDLKSKTIKSLISRPQNNVCQIGDEACAILPLNEPNDAIFWDKNTIIIADTNNHLIRKFNLLDKSLVDLKIN